MSSQLQPLNSNGMKITILISDRVNWEDSAGSCLLSMPQSRYSMQERSEVGALCSSLGPQVLPGVSHFVLYSFCLKVKGNLIVLKTKSKAGKPCPSVCNFKKRGWSWPGDEAQAHHLSPAGGLLPGLLHLTHHMLLTFLAISSIKVPRKRENRNLHPRSEDGSQTQSEGTLTHMMGQGHTHLH